MSSPSPSSPRGSASAGSSCLSGRGEPEALAAERAFAAAAEAGGATWSVVRASWFAQNFTEGFFADGVRSGELALPVGDVPEPFVDVDDVADVVVVALTEPRPARVMHEVTGPQRTDVRRGHGQGRRPARARPARRVQRRAARRRVFRTCEVDLYAYLFSEILDGRNTQTTDAIERALGRPPRTFDQSLVAR